jgi:hypothetical protein
MTKDSFVFLDDNYKNVKCMICSKGNAYCWYDYYVEKRLHCKDCFYEKTKSVVSKFIETGEKDYDVLQYWIVGYKALYQRYDVEMRLNKQLQENVDRLVSDKMEMQYDIDVLKRHLELLERQIG